MTGIFNGIQNLVSAIQTLINGVKMGIQFLVNLVKTMFEAIKLLGTTIINVSTLIATLPTWLIAFASCTLAISVLYIILGRNTGK